LKIRNQGSSPCVDSDGNEKGSISPFYVDHGPSLLVSISIDFEGSGSTLKRRGRSCSRTAGIMDGMRNKKKKLNKKGAPCAKALLGPFRDVVVGDGGGR
jgi:hypothetical protein